MGWLKCRSGRVMINFIIISGLIFTFGLVYCDCYIRDIVIPWIVKPGFCSIHFTVTLAGLKNVNRYVGNIVLAKIVILGICCILPVKLISLMEMQWFSGLPADFQVESRWKNLTKCLRYPAVD